MLGMIDRQVFESLEESALIWACIHPVVQEIRGKDPAQKLKVYSGLTRGQRSLLMFQVLHGHSENGAEELIGVVESLSIDGIWGELKSGMSYFEDASLLSLLDEMETMQKKGSADVAAVCRIGKKLKENMSDSIRRVCAHIRKNPQEFVRFGE